MIKRWADEAWEDFLYWQKNDKKIFKKILELIKDIDRNSYTGIGKPEGQKHELSRYWSRRINEGNRIVYKIENNEVFFLQCGSYYRKK